LQSARGRASLGGGGGGGGFRGGGGGGGARAGGGGARAGGGGRGGGGRRSDVALKHDITLLGHLDNGLGFYRFSYVGSRKAYVGVIAQEVQTVMPEAVSRDRDGYLRVFYGKLGVKFRTYDPVGRIGRTGAGRSRATALMAWTTKRPLIAAAAKISRFPPNPPQLRCGSRML
jgi:hypothetical protein